MMMPFKNCPICGGEMVKKTVQKLLQGGNHTAVMTVEAEVCLQCGERLYSLETVRRFEEIEAQLQRGETQDLIPVGQAFRVS